MIAADVKRSAIRPECEVYVVRSIHAPCHPRSEASRTARKAGDLGTYRGEDRALDEIAKAGKDFPPAPRADEGRSKRRDAHYRSGRCLTWLKVKNPNYVDGEALGP